jgi:hypothetical protein
MAYLGDGSGSGEGRRKKYSICTRELRKEEKEIGSCEEANK